MSEMLSSSSSGSITSSHAFGSNGILAVATFLSPLLLAVELEESSVIKLAKPGGGCLNVVGSNDLDVVVTFA
jgi:hypothetical protein